MRKNKTHIFCDNSCIFVIFMWMSSPHCISSSRSVFQWYISIVSLKYFYRNCIMLLVVECNNSGNISQTRKLCVKKKYFFRKKESSWCTYIKLRVWRFDIYKKVRKWVLRKEQFSHSYWSTKYNWENMNTKTKRREEWPRIEEDGGRKSGCFQLLVNTKKEQTKSAYLSPLRRRISLKVMHLLKLLN